MVLKVMASDLKPTLNRLREERNRFLQYSKAKENLEALERFCVAYDFDSTEKHVECTYELVKVSPGSLKWVTRGWKNCGQGKQRWKRKQLLSKIE